METLKLTLEIIAELLGIVLASIGIFSNRKRPINKKKKTRGNKAA